MTITEPHGEPTLLQVLLRVEHDRLQLLVSEGAKYTPTPGVHDKVVDELRRALATHLNAEAAVVHPAAREWLADDDVDLLERDARALRDVLATDDAELQRTGVAVQRHVDTCGVVLGKLLDSAGDRRMAALAVDYSVAVEAAPDRMSPT